MTYASGIKNRIGQYHYADGALARRTIDGTDYVIVIAGAYNAFGLIGPEHNGIAVLDDTAKRVVLDRHAPEPSGYSGPSATQQIIFDKLVAESDAEFLRFIAEHPRTRREA